MKKIILALGLILTASTASAASKEMVWRTIVVDEKTFCTIGAKGPIVIHQECFKNPNYKPQKDDGTKKLPPQSK